MSHQQTWVKVNAPVDERVAELIEALSAFPKLQTFASCQGGWPRSDTDKEGHPAEVFFRYGSEDNGHPYNEIANFVLGYFAPGLDKELGDLVSIELCYADYGVRAVLAVRQGAMKRAVETIRSLRREYKD